MIVNHHGQTSTETHITFFIDGENVGRYDHMPDNTTNILYRVPVYANSTLPYGEHSLEIVADGLKLSLLLFDYVVYTTKADANSVALTATSSSASSKIIRPSPAHTSVSSPMSSYPVMTSSPAVPLDNTTHSSIPSPTPLPHTDSKRLATIAGVTAALSFICGMAALTVFRTRKSIMLYVRRARGRDRRTQERSRIYPAGSPTSASDSPLAVDFSNSRSSLVQLGSPSGASHLLPTPSSAIVRETSPVHGSGPMMLSNAHMHPRASPPRHSVDVPRSAVSSSRTGTDHSASTISELRRELRSLRENLRDLQSPRKHRLRLVDGRSAGSAAADTPVRGVPVSLASVKEEV